MNYEKCKHDMLIYRDERIEGESFEAYDDRVLALLSLDEIVDRIKKHYNLTYNDNSLSLIR